MFSFYDFSFYDAGFEYGQVGNYQTSEDAWESAISNDERIRESLTGVHPDDREISAAEFGEGFAEAMRLMLNDDNEQTAPSRY